MKRVEKIALPGKDYTKTARFRRLAKEYLMNDKLVFDKEEPRSKKHGQIKCPICGGQGFIEHHKPNTVVDLKRIAAKKLRESGMTMREIQKLLGYRAVSAIKYLLK